MTMPTMTGADRFQFFLDKDGRKNTGIGNTIKTHIVLKGVLTREQISGVIKNNKAIEFLSSLSAKRKFYSFQFFWKQGTRPGLENIFSYEVSKSAQVLIDKALTYDCNPERGSPILVDVIADIELKLTHIILSVNHSLLDYAGMELLLKSFSEDSDSLILHMPPQKPFSLFKRLVQTIQATAFVAKRSGWNIQRLEKTSVNYKPVFTELSISNQELRSESVSSRSIGIPRYLACSIHALCKSSKIFKNHQLPVFVPVPLNRRTEKYNRVLLSNRFSFLFFRINTNEFSNVKSLERAFLQQMILQAQQKIPEKFDSLLSVFSLLPNSIYRAFLNLPSKGHSSTFAFSNLPVSVLDGSTFLGMKIIDFTHYPPFLSPPGLNLAIIEMKDGIKLVSCYDSTRLTTDDANLLLQDIKSNLISS